MRHGYTILNKSVNVLTRVWAIKNAVRPSFAKRQRTVKKVLYVIFFLTTSVQLSNYLLQRAELSQVHSIEILF